MSTLQNILFMTNPASLNLYTHMNILSFIQMWPIKFWSVYFNHPVANYYIDPNAQIILTWVQNFIPMVNESSRTRILI